MSKVSIYGRKFELNKNLEPEELQFLKDRMGLYLRAWLALTHWTMIGLVQPTGFKGETEIVIITRRGRQGWEAQLSYPQGHNEEYRWVETK